MEKQHISGGKIPIPTHTHSLQVQHVRADEINQGLLAEKMDSGRLACDRNGDRSTCQMTDGYPLAQLNTSLHLYNKQLKCNPSTLRCFCRPHRFSPDVTFSVIPSISSSFHSTHKHFSLDNGQIGLVLDL